MGKTRGEGKRRERKGREGKGGEGETIGVRTLVDVIQEAPLDVRAEDRQDGDVDANLRGGRFFLPAHVSRQINQSINQSYKSYHINHITSINQSA